MEKAVPDEFEGVGTFQIVLVQLMDNTSWSSALLIQFRTILITTEPSVQSY